MAYKISSHLVTLIDWTRLPRVFCGTDRGLHQSLSWQVCSGWLTMSFIGTAVHWYIDSVPMVPCSNGTDVGTVSFIGNSGTENYGFHSLPLKANLLSNLHSAKDGSWCLKGGGRMSLMTQDAVFPWGLSNQVITEGCTLDKAFLNNTSQKKRL